MDEPNQAPKQVCSIRIMFPVDTDEQAIECKKKIAVALSEIKNAQINFSLMNTPPTTRPIG